MCLGGGNVLLDEFCDKRGIDISHIDAIIVIAGSIRQWIHLCEVCNSLRSQVGHKPDAMCQEKRKLQVGLATPRGVAIFALLVRITPRGLA